MPTVSAAGLLTLQTPLGWLAARIVPEGVTRLSLGHATRARAIEAVAGTTGRAVAATAAAAGRVQTTARLLEELLERYFAGESVCFDPVAVVLRLPPFTTTVLTACRAIPFGRTTTYGQLAAAIGHPRAARAVGQALARNPVPLIVPCHRVLAGNGRLGGFTSPGGVELKRALLALEGVRFE